VRDDTRAGENTGAGEVVLAYGAALGLRKSAVIAGEREFSVPLHSTPHTLSCGARNLIV
jgi:hypothetical protein